MRLSIIQNTKFYERVDDALLTLTDGHLQPLIVQLTLKIRSSFEWLNHYFQRLVELSGDKWRDLASQ